MKIGYIGPDGVAFDQKGKPWILGKDKWNKPMLRRVLSSKKEVILDKGEYNLTSHNLTGLYIKDKWKDTFFNFLWEATLGSGPAIVTNKRIMHYRDPDPRKRLESIFDGSSTFQVPNKVAQARTAGRRLERGIKEYCEVSFSEIARIDIVHDEEKPSYINIISDNQKYQITLIPELVESVKNTLDKYSVSSEVIGSGKKKRTVTWYTKPEDVDDKKLKQRRKLREKALKHLSDGQIKKGAELMEEVVSIRPNEPEAIDELCELLFKLKEYEKYISYVDRCLEMDHSLRIIVPLYRFNKANALRKLGRHDEALTEIDRFIAEDPDENTAVGVYGKVAIYDNDLKQRDKALNCINKALSQYPQDGRLLKIKSIIEGRGKN